MPTELTGLPEDYPRDEATRALVVNALALAAKMRREPGPGVVEGHFLTAVDRWHSVHAPTRMHASSMTEGSGASGR